MKYRIEMTATKAFYVEADSQEAALEHYATQDEHAHSCGCVDWEFVDATAKEESKPDNSFYPTLS